MSNAAVIKEFLVALGFKINGQDKFTSSIGAATVKAVELGAAVTTASSLVVAGVAKIAEQFEQLYFASQRTNSSVENIRSYGFAIGQMGSSAESALASLEALGSKMRHSPGFEGLIKNQGVQTRVNGELRDTVEILGDLSKQFAAMPMYRGLAVAEAMGIDEKTFLAMRQGAGQFGDEYRHMLRAAGVDSQTAAKSSHEFMNELRLLGAAFSVLSQKVASALTVKIGGNLRKLRESLVANFGRISEAIAKVLGFVMRLADAVGIMALRGIQVVGRLVDWFNGLSEGSQNVIKWIAGILVAWKALSAGFLATPLGRLMALVSALALLWDDYQVWKEGGQSLIDWGKWAPGIEAAINGIKMIGGAVHDGLSFLGDWRAAFEILLAYVAGSWALGMLGSVSKVAASIAATMTSALAGLLGNVALVGAAGALGYALGSVIHDKLLAGTKFDDALGRGIAKTLALFGNKEAQEALDAEKRATNSKNSSEAAKPTSKSTQPANVAPAGDYNAAAPGSVRGDSAHAMSVFQGLGWAKEQAAGIVANLQRESALKADAVGDRGKAFGVAQWHPDRQAEFAKVFGKDIKQSSLDEQLKFVHYELTQGAEQKAGALLKASQNAESAGMVMSKYYERPADQAGEMAMRGAMAGRLASVSSADTKPVELNQTTHITVNGGNEPKEIARDITLAQNSVNETLVRNMRGAVLQ